MNEPHDTHRPRNTVCAFPGRGPCSVVDELYVLVVACENLLFLGHISDPTCHASTVEYVPGVP